MEEIRQNTATQILWGYNRLGVLLRFAAEIPPEYCATTCTSLTFPVGQFLSTRPLILTSVAYGALVLRMYYALARQSCSDHSSLSPPPPPASVSPYSSLSVGPHLLCWRDCCRYNRVRDARFSQVCWSESCAGCSLCVLLSFACWHGGFARNVVCSSACLMQRPSLPCSERLPCNVENLFTFGAPVSLLWTLRLGRAADQVCSLPYIWGGGGGGGGRAAAGRAGGGPGGPGGRGGQRQRER